MIQKLGVHFSFPFLQTSNYSGQRRRRERRAGEGEGVTPPQPFGSLGECHRKLPQQGMGRNPSRKRFWGISCAILCDFMQHLVHLTAAWKWEIPKSLYWLVGASHRYNFYRAMHFSAYARSWDRMSSVCPSVRPSVCNVGGLWSHRLEILEINYTDN